MVNADESEPGTFKDRYIMHQDPHQLIEGIMITCFANNVKQAYIYIRGEFPARRAHPGEGHRRGARGEFRRPEFLGIGLRLRNLRASRRRRLHLRRRDRPDRVARGQAAVPAHQAAVFSRGARALSVPDDREQRRDALPREVHRGRGRRGLREDRHAEQHRHAHPLRLAATCRSPGYYEFEVGKITMGQLLNEVCGGPLPGRKFKAVIPGGSSAKILKFGERYKGKRKVGADMVDYDWGVEDVPMDFDSLAHDRHRWAAPAA